MIQVIGKKGGLSQAGFDGFSYVYYVAWNRNTSIDAQRLTAHPAGSAFPTLFFADDDDFIPHFNFQYDLRRKTWGDQDRFDNALFEFNSGQEDFDESEQEQYAADNCSSAGGVFLSGSFFAVLDSEFPSSRVATLNAEIFGSGPVGPGNSCFRRVNVSLIIGFETAGEIVVKNDTTVKPDQIVRLK